jgi:hypothetical protein
MTNRNLKTSIALLVAVAGLSTFASEAAARIVRGAGGGSPRRPQPSTVAFVFEGGLAQPLGEQADDFDGNYGYGAGTGYELGFRLRQHLGPHFAVSPTFHYVDFGATSGVTDFPQGAALAYEVSTSLFRYGLELQYWLGDSWSEFRPYLLGGIALAHNRYRDSLQYYQDFRTGMNGPSWTAGFGMKMGVFELTGAYVGNRFETANLAPADVPAGTQHRHDWDYAIVRLGFAFGTP